MLVSFNVFIAGARLCRQLTYFTQYGCIGHMCDPEELPGLAHFCEHMLFLGTEKYPVENEYPRFLSEHGVI